MLTRLAQPSQLLAAMIASAATRGPAHRLLSAVLCAIRGHAWDERPGPTWLTCRRCCRKIGH